MMGKTHLIFGALCGATVATARGEDTATILTSTLIATVVSHGGLSPDMDQSKPWRAVAKLLPPGMDGLGGHRYGLSHWIGLLLLFAWLALPRFPDSVQWVYIALLTGWCSHLLGDFIFGKLCLLTPMGKGPKIGVGMDTDGFVESGKATVFGKERRIIPFGPTRVLLTAALAWVLIAVPAGLTLDDVLVYLTGAYEWAVVSTASAG